MIAHVLLLTEATPIDLSQASRSVAAQRGDVPNTRKET